MKNFVKPGDVLEAPAPAGGVVSGDFALIGTIGGIATVTAADGVVCPFQLEGVFSLPKATGQAWTQGAALYWDATAKKFTTTSAGNTRYGFADAAALAADTFGNVNIYPL
jgi:predicted RecA/RadA family phage recombinase